MTEIITFIKSIWAFINLYWALAIICYFVFQWTITPIIYPKKHNISWLPSYNRFRFAHWYLIPDLFKVFWDTLNWTLSNYFQVNFKKWFYSKVLKKSIKTEEEVFGYIEKLLPLPTDQKGKLFEEYIRDRIKDHGFIAHTTGDLRKKGELPESIQKRGGSGEQGVDVITFLSPKNKQRTLKVIIQCKCYSNTVSNSAVQEINTALKMYDAQIAVVVSNQDFTGPSIDLADVNNIILIGQKNLVDFINDPQMIFNLTTKSAYSKAS